MEHRRVNRIYTAILIVNIAVELLIWYVFEDLVDLENLVQNELIVEGILILPAMLGLLIKKDEEPLSERLGFRKLRPATIGLVALYAIVIMPIGTLANSISLLFTDNEVAMNSSLYLNQNFAVSFFFVAVLGPFVEEFVFRGVIFRGYRRAGRYMAAAFLSALLFGLVHMNLNQFVYAFVLGIMFALVTEATDSIWASFICHFLFNGESVIAMYLYDLVYPGAYEDYVPSAEGLGETILIYAIIAVFAFALAILLLKAISKKENREEEFKNMFYNYDTGVKKQRLVTPILVVGLIINISYMILWELLKYL